MFLLITWTELVKLTNNSLLKGISEISAVSKQTHVPPHPRMIRMQQWTLPDNCLAKLAVLEKSQELIINVEDVMYVYCTKYIKYVCLLPT